MSIDRENRVEAFSELTISVNGKMEKEKEKKRKRVTETGEVDGGSGRMKKEKEVEREKAEAAPSEEEVEEFFEILRRMQVAVKYFEKSSDGDGNANDKANGDGRRLTDLLGTEVDDLKANEKGLNRRLVNGVLDLNAVPAESNSV